MKPELSWVIDRTLVDEILSICTSKKFEEKRKDVNKNTFKVL